MKDLETVVANALKHADIEIGGKKAWDITIHDKRFYRRVIRERQLGLGEAYMDGWWDAARIDEFVAHLLESDISSKIKLSPDVIALGFVESMKWQLTNKQDIKRAHKNASHHYNIGNDLYERMLDKRMIYSCAYWQNGAKTLDEAQEAKLDLICRKLQLKKGMTLLDIGCGWGGFVEFAAKKYGVVATGISPAAEQVKIAKKRTKGLKVKILQQDYREVKGSFDRIVSIGMLEHVGIKNYPTFFATCDKLLAPGGMMLHHTIGSNNPHNPAETAWIDKYIFPGGMLPTIAEIAKPIEGTFVIEDLHNFGPDYDKTLMAWHRNFLKHYDEISDTYDEQFKRMWEYYLLSCAGIFRIRGIHLWQIIMRRPERSDTYKAVR